MSAEAAAEPPRDGGPLRSARVSVLAAAFLVAIKLTTGLITGSLGLVAEAIHSGTDLAAALLTLFALRVAVRPADREHPYGHGKAEHLAALFEGALLVVASIIIAVQAVGRLGDGGGHDVEATWWSFLVLGVVLAVDLSRMIVSLRAARRHNSAALASNALHFGSDMLGTLAVLVGLVLVRAGRPEGDAVAALLVAALVVVAAARLMRANVNVLMDTAPAGAEAAARAAVSAADQDLELRRLRVRSAGGRHFVEVVAAYRPDAALGQGHAAADAVEEAVSRALPGSDVVVHIEPGEAADDLRERASAAALTVRGVREIHNVRVMDVGGRPELSLHIKLPADLELAAAHEIASAVEEAIHRAVPEAADVHTHIEPLAPAAETGAEPDRDDVAEEERAIRAVVASTAGAELRRLRFQQGEDGLVALMTVTLAGPQTTDSAHRASAEIVRRIHDAAPRIAEVIVHTEPGEPAS